MLEKPIQMAQSKRPKVNNTPILKHRWLNRIKTDSLNQVSMK